MRVLHSYGKLADSFHFWHGFFERVEIIDVEQEEGLQITIEARNDVSLNFGGAEYWLWRR
jgi:hypothetical protein